MSRILHEVRYSYLNTEYQMHLGRNFRRSGLLLTEVLFRHASALRLYKYPVLLRISHSLSYVRKLPGLQEHPVQSLCRLSTSVLYALLLLRMLHGLYVLPATGTLWNEGMVLLSSPNEERNTTDSTP